MKRLSKRMRLGVFVAMVLAGSTFLAQQPVQQCAADTQVPDLIIQRIYLIKPIHECNVVVVVKNRGPGRVPNFVWTDHKPKSAGVYLYINGRGWGGASIWKFDPFKKLQTPGGTAEYISKLTISGPATVKAVVDMWDNVKETNNNNNFLVKRFEEGDCDALVPEIY